MGYLAVAETTHYIAHKLCSGGGYFVIGLTEKAHGSAQEKEGIEKKNQLYAAASVKFVVIPLTS